jgi:hypothetical protein
VITHPSGVLRVARATACRKKRAMPSFCSIVAPPKPIAGAGSPASSPPTDRDTLKRRLAQSEGHVTMSKAHIASQSAFVAKLVRDGYDASQAQALLLRFGELRELYIADRDRLRGELGE